MLTRQRSKASPAPEFRRLAVSLAGAAVIAAVVVATPPAAAQSANARDVAATAGAAYDAQTLQTFAAAAARVLALRGQYYPRIRAAEIAGSQEKADRLFDEMRTQMTAAIGDAGISETQYRAISSAAKTDENLRRQINAILQGAPPAQQQARSAARAAAATPQAAAPPAPPAPPPDDGARERLAKELAKASRERDRYRAEQAALREQSEKLERELAAVKAQEASRRERLNAQKEQAQAERKKVEGELDNLLGEMTRMRGELTTLQSRDATLREQLEAQRVRADAAQINKEARLASFRHEIKRLADRLATAQDALASMSSQLQSGDHTNRRPAPFEALQPLERRPTSLDRVLAKAGPSFALRQELDTEIARRERERRAREAEREALQAEIAGLSHDLSKTYRAMAELIGEPTDEGAAAANANFANLDIDDGTYTLDVSQETAQLFEMGPPQLTAAPQDPQGEILLDEPVTLGVGDTLDQPGTAGPGDGAALDTPASTALRLDPTPAEQIAAVPTDADDAQQEGSAATATAPADNTRPVHRIVRDSEAFAPTPAASARPAAPGAAPLRDGETVADGAEAYRAGDFARALQIWSAHAEDGDRKAQFHLGALYFEGRGTDADLATAYFWLLVSAYQGYKRADSLLAAVGEKLSLSEINESDARARQWLEERSIEVTRVEETGGNRL